MKVTFCSYDKPDNVGGPFSWLEGLLPALRDSGVEVRCLILLHWGTTGPTVEALKKAGIPCEAVLAHEATEDRIEWILSKLADDPPDIFVPNLVVAAYFAARSAREAGIATVGILHSDDPFYAAILDEFVDGDPAYAVSGLVCVSRELLGQAEARRPRLTRVRRIPYGVHIPDAALRRVPGKLRIAYVGRFAEEQKRISEVARALCVTTSLVPGSEAVLYGDGPERAALEDVLRLHGNPASVRVHGPVAHVNLIDHLLETDVIVLLSDYEGLPISLLEAMACGCVPVCLEMRSGIPELVFHDVTGLIVTDRESDFTGAIATLAREPGLWATLSAGARDLVAANYSESLSARMWVDLLKELQPVGDKKTINPAARLELPPVNPAFSSADRRRAVHPARATLYQRSRRLAGRIKRVLASRGTDAPDTAGGPLKLRRAVLMKVAGGLANQMMIYRAGRYLADIKRASLILDVTSYHDHSNPARNLQLLEYDLRYDAMIFSTEVMRQIEASNSVYRLTREMLPRPGSSESQKVASDLRSRPIVSGDFWLSLFLRGEADDHARSTGGLAELTLDPDTGLDDRSREYLALIRGMANPVAIHVRRGDFATHDGNLLLTADYYTNAIRTLEQELDGPVFFVFSDEPDWCRANLQSAGTIHVVDCNDEAHAYRDLYLASQCRHFILSNESTFSHQIVQLNAGTPDRLVITSTQDDLARSSDKKRI